MSKQFSTLEQILGAKSKIAVLRCLFHSRLGYSGSAIAKQTGVGLFAVQNTLATLESIGLVEVERGKVEHRYKLNMHHYLVANGLRALFEGERRMRAALARDLAELLEGKVTAAGLFGSFARGAARAGSDIDLLIVVQNRKEHERASHILSDAQSGLTKKYGWPVQPVIFELRRLLSRRSNGPALLDEAARDWQHVAGLTPVELRKSA